MDSPCRLLVGLAVAVVGFMLIGHIVGAITGTSLDGEEKIHLGIITIAVVVWAIEIWEAISEAWRKRKL